MPEITLPVPGEDREVWGPKLNNVLVALNTAFDTVPTLMDGKLDASVVPDLSSTYATQDNLAEKASLAGATFTGTVTAPLVDTGSQVYNIAASGAMGDGVSDDTAALSRARTDAGEAPVYLQPGRSYRVASNLSLDGEWQFGAGATLKPDSGVTVTLTGTVNAPPQHVFDVSNGGVVQFSTNSTILPVVYPQWWGAVGDGSTDSSAAFLACAAAVNRFSNTGISNGVRVTVPPGKYIVDGQIVIAARVGWDLPRGAWVQRPVTSVRTDPVFVLNGNESELVQGGKVESLVAAPDGIVVVGNIVNTVGGRVAMTADSNIVTAETPIFTADMVGYDVGINDAAGVGVRLTGTITAFTDSTHVTVSVNASATVAHSRALFGSGGTTVSWARVDVKIYGRSAAAGSGDIGLKFNSYPQSLGKLTAQNKAHVLCWGVDTGVEFGPEANLNTVEQLDGYKVRSTVVRYNEADECRVNSGTVSNSSNVTFVQGIGSRYCVTQLSGEPGGSQAKGCNLNADTASNLLILADNTSAASVDSGTANTVINHSFGPFPNLRVTEYAAASGTISIPSNMNASAVHDFSMVGNVTLVLPTGLSQGIVSELTVTLRQDATGGRTATWPASVKWDGGTTPTFDTAANHMNMVRLFTLDGGTTWRARLDWSGAT